MTKKIRLLLFLLLTFFLGACSGLTNSSDGDNRSVATQEVDSLPIPEKNGWWNDSVFYEIFVRSFYDSDGDGVGDLTGVITKLDYLNDGDSATDSDLGINGIWLMPIFPTTSYHGYDVTDYLDVNPEYGTIDDLSKLLEEAHKRGIKIILDLVINHTSAQHAWFQLALNPNSPFHDYYIWSESDPGYRGPYGEKVWHKASNGKYYYAYFDDSMPDLNYENPQVTKEIYEIVKFWVQIIGIDGFRLDGIRHLVEEGSDQINTQCTHAWLKEFRDYCKSLNPELLLLGEVWDNSREVTKYIQGDELDLAFNFDLASAFISSISNSNNIKTENIIENEIDQFDNGLGMATFLTNHDMVRSMNYFHGLPEKAKAAAAMLLTSPGVPFIYYGEEIGMLGVKPDPQIRTPMQWTSEENVGFTTGKPWEPINSGYANTNVLDESEQSNSLLGFYRKFIPFRLSHPALRQGIYSVIDTATNKLFAALAVNQTEAILILINYSTKEISDYELSLPSSYLRGTNKLVDGFTNLPINTLTLNDQGGFESFMPVPTIKPNEVLIFLLE